MPKLIFEDAELSPISNLIKTCYKQYDWRDFVIFTGGKDNLLSKLKEQYSPDDYYFIFVDLIPDNYDVIKTCRRLLKSIRKEEYKNVLVLPVICAEYYVLKAFKGIYSENSFSKVALEFGNYRSISNCTNFENFCKHALTSLEESCIHTKDYTIGFYDLDCVFRKISLDLKSWMFISKYPLFIETDNCLVSHVKADILETVNQAINNYYSLVKKFSEYNLITQIYDNYKLDFILPNN